MPTLFDFEEMKLFNVPEVITTMEIPLECVGEQITAGKISELLRNTADIIDKIRKNKKTDLMICLQKKQIDMNTFAKLMQIKISKSLKDGSFSQRTMLDGFNTRKNAVIPNFMFQNWCLSGDGLEELMRR